MGAKELRLRMVGGNSEKGLTPLKARNVFCQCLVVFFTIMSPGQYELLRPYGARVLGVRM